MSDEKKLPEYLRLTDNHPTSIKVAKLCDLADKLGISFAFSGQRVIVEDRDRDKKLPPLYLEDIEDHHWFEEFPFTTEYKLVYQNPEWLAKRKKEQEEYYAKKEEEARLVKEKLAAQAKAEAEKRARETEARERRMLADLKAKYGE
jgi:hypothetical protein